MSSYEDIYGMATRIVEALKNIQWKAPDHWELGSIIEPFQEQVILKLGTPQNLAASPTLAAPTNIRPFLNSIQASTEDPTQLYIFVAFLVAVPLFSTFFVAMLTNVNIVLKLLGLPLARNPVKASPLTVILVMITIFGNIPLVNFFPERAAHVQAPLLIQPGHYTGVMAWVLQIAAAYEIVELVSCVLLQIIEVVRYRSIQIRRLLQPASIVAWLITFAGFALRMWFTRVSLDTATSPVQSGSKVWVWRNGILRTDVSYQSSDESLDDLFISGTYFVATYIASSLFIRYVLAPRHEVYQEVEPTYIKITASSSIETANSSCQTIVSGEDWVTKSSIATDAEKVDKIQAVINSDMRKASWLGKAWCEEAYWAGKGLKNLTLMWQNDHTALQTHVALLRSLRMLVEQHKIESRNQRQHAEEVSTNVIRLEETLTEREREYEETLKSRDKEYQDRLDSLARKVAALEKGSDVPVTALDDTNTQQASQPDASLGPREAESHSASANTPDLQNTPEGHATLRCDTKPDTENSTEPVTPPPPSNAADSSFPAGTSNGDRNPKPTDTKPDTSSMNLASLDGSPVPPAATVSSAVGGTVEPEKASDSEMDTDAINVSGGSDDEVMEEIGTGIWSRTQKFKFRSEIFYSHLRDFVGRHFTIQEIQTITSLLIDFRDNVANETQRKQVSTILDAGFPYRAGLRYQFGVDYVSVLLDLAELHKKPTRERLVTVIPPMAVSIACGVAPHHISMPNGYGRTWEEYIEHKLQRNLEDHINTLAAEKDRAYLREVGTRVVNNVERLFDGRPELLRKVAPVQYLKADLTQTWDINLITRRMLENFGLIEFRLDSTEGTSAEEYIPPVLLEPTPVKPIVIETPSIKTPSEVPTAMGVSETPSIEIQPTVPANTDTSSIDVSTTDVGITPTCGETPSSEAPSQEVSTTTIPTCSKTLATEVPQEVPAAAASPLIEKPSIEVPSAEPVVTVSDCSQTPSVDAPSCNNPTLPEPLAIVVPDEPTQLPSALTNALPQSPTKATAVSTESSIAPCVESPSQISPPVSQTQSPLPSSSASTSTRPTPSKSTAPDWRQEALQDFALQQQTQQRPIAPLPRRNGRKARGGRGRPRNSNA